MEHKNRVYLSGGLKSNWQGTIIKELNKKFIFHNPNNHALENSKLYTAWDLHHIKLCDIVFAYMEPNNQSGYGLALEVGYAAALNKTIILIDEKSQKDSGFESKFKIIRESASAVFDNLEEGVQFLKSFT